MIRGFLTALFVLGLFNFSEAQTIENIVPRLENGHVIISYDLLGTDVNQKYTVVITSSLDNYITPLQEIKGDVGKNITPGRKKTANWNANKQLGTFKDVVSFEVKATLTFTPLKFITPTKNEALKLGKTYQLKWKGGASDASLKVELLKNNALAYELPTTQNVGNLAWEIPKTLTAGNNYNLKLSDLNNPSASVFSSTFSIKKVNIAVYLVPAAVVVGGIATYLIIKGNKEPPPTPPIIEPDLPAVPDTPGG